MEPPGALPVLRAERIAAGGDAIAREPGGRVVFVTGALPGELVRVVIDRSKRDFAHGHAVDVLEPAPERVVPPCPFVGAGCGGCGWQHITPSGQRRLKKDLVADAFRRIGKLPDALVEPAAALASERFRTTVRLGVTPAGVLGFRAARRNEIVPVDDCLVAHPGLAELLGDARVPGADEVVLRIGGRTGERLARWDGPGRPAGFPTDVALGDETWVTELVHGRRLRVSARSFFQSSPEAAEALVETVLGLAGDHATGSFGPVIDAYGGVGLFASAVGDDAIVTHIELAPSSCADARVNLAGRPARVVESAVEAWSPTAAALVIADPARRGLGADAVGVLGATGCERFVLVSCDAAAAARDVRLLLDAGFAHQRSVVLDPFPHTPHVELVTLLVR